MLAFYLVIVNGCKPHIFHSIASFKRVVDDILDQGFTLSAIREKMKQEYPEANIKTCVFLKKNLAHPSDEAAALRRKYKADFTGFEVEDRWVVGYGLDAGECYRELPYIAIANEECFRHG